MTTSPVVTITDELVAELEALADLATDGPWQYVEHDDCEYIEGPCNEFICSSADHIHDSEFIAQTNPAVIKALLSERAELKRDAERYKFLRSLSYEDDTEGEWTVGIDEAFEFPRNASHETAFDVAVDQAMQERQE